MIRGLSAAAAVLLASAILCAESRDFDRQLRQQAATDRAWRAASDGFMRMEKISYRSGAGDLDVPAFVASCRHLHPREAVQELTRAVVETCGGDLRDDATVLCFDWHGGPARERDASAGADR